MQQPHYQFLHGGLYSELDALPVGEAIDHLRNYLGNFLLDGVVASAYLNRLAKDFNQDSSSQVSAWVRYLLEKLVQLQPFNCQVRQLRAQVSSVQDDLFKYLERTRLPKNIHRKLTSLNSATSPVKRRSHLKELFREYSFAPELIEEMLLADLEADVSPGQDWLDRCTAPPKLKPLIYSQAMRYCLLQGDMQRARVLLEASTGAVTSEEWLNTAAEVLVRSGDHQQGMAYYRRSLERDPLQVPVRYRLQELEHPIRQAPEVLRCQTAVFLYSYNKCDLLWNTLTGLADTELGASRVVVLLNNCTDGSREAVKSLNRERFGNRIEVIDLPANIGAPAARNWLLSTEAAKTSDYVAFLDDDVEVPKHWLSMLLTTLRQTPQAGVAGTKVLAPGRPRRLQYLYRNVSIARGDLLRVSLDTPDRNYDSGLYDFVRPTHNVMGCCHVFTRQALDAVPSFDLRFSPTQMDDIAHDLDLSLAGFEVMYCGLVECVHHQKSGVGRNTSSDLVRLGNVLGNDVKFHYRFLPEIDALKRMNNLDTVPEQPPMNW